MKSPINNFKKYHSRSRNLILNVEIYEFFSAMISVAIKSSSESVLTKYARFSKMTYFSEFREPTYMINNKII